MAETYFCGDCREEFTPEPCMCGGHNLCSSCRAKRREALQNLKTKYDNLDRDDREKGPTFCTIVERSVPQRRVEHRCNRCQDLIDEGKELCSWCNEKERREEEEREEKRNLSREEKNEEFRDLLDDLG